jgi:hypothetical protein
MSRLRVAHFPLSARTVFSCLVYLAVGAVLAACSDAVTAPGASRNIAPSATDLPPVHVIGCPVGYYGTYPDCYPNDPYTPWIYEQDPCYSDWYSYGCPGYQDPGEYGSDPADGSELVSSFPGTGPDVPDYDLTGLTDAVASSGFGCQYVPCPTDPKMVIFAPAVQETAVKMYAATAADGYERGAWIYWDPKTNTITVGVWMVGTSGDMPQMRYAPNDAIGQIHSHPPASYQGPSGNDQLNGINNNIYMLVTTQNWTFIMDTQGTPVGKTPHS